MKWKRRGPAGVPVDGASLARGLQSYDGLTGVTATNGARVMGDKSMMKWTFKHRAERFCARLNDGLTAVAVVLAMLVFIVGTYRTLENVETAIEANDSDWSVGPAVSNQSVLQQAQD